MINKITTIARTGVNCYIIRTETGFFMVDTGFPFARKAINKALIDAGCRPGELKLVIITHGDTDHTGNCLFLRKRYNAKIAAHPHEGETCETGDLARNRKNKRSFFLRTGFAISKIVIKNKFIPDISLDDGDDLSAYGFNARVIHTPGHSLGSVSILTADGDFFCGDFLVNSREPSINHLVDDPAEMAASVEKIKALKIRKIYPGHGRAFTVEDFLKNYR